MITEYKQTPIGQVPKDWDVVRLGKTDVADIIMGQSPPSSTYNERGEGLPFLQGKAEFGDIYPNPVKYTTEPIKIAEKGDILMSVRAPVGDVNVAPFKLCIGRGLGVIRIKKGSNLFYFYFFQKTKKIIKNIGKGSTFTAITKDELEKLIIPILPLDEQRRIAEVLHSADISIRKVDEAIAKTERLKKGLMQKLLTKGIGHKEFKETASGRIPREWKIVRLKDVAIIERGKFAHRPRNEPRFYGGDIPFIQTGDIAKADGIIRNYTQTLNDEGLKISKLFKKGTIVISIAGNIGDVGILYFDACFPDSVIGISARSDVNSLYLMYLLRNSKHELSEKAPRSTQKNINLQILEALKILLPALPEQGKIAEVLSTVDKKLELDRMRKKKLERIKKGLMNDLLTGRKRVKVAG